MRYKLSLILVITAVASLIVSVSAFSEQYAVVRNIQGGGFVQGSQDGQTQSLGVNVPVMEGDNVWTDGAGQMELLLPEGNHLWLDRNTRMEFDQLPSDDQSEVRPVRARLWKGVILIDQRIWLPAMADYLIATPSASVSPSSSGVFLVDVESVDRTRITCLQGSCAVISAGVAIKLADGQMTYVDYGYAPLNPVYAEKVSSPLLAYRQQHMPEKTSGVSQRYLPSNLYAYSEDLDSNGSWNYTADYGYVWRPTYVVADWAPYTYGHWGWEPWGTTWCPYDAWGWAPFHYGRWCFSVGFGWGWCPQSIFSPAWVSWYWDDAGWLGWCPLGYYDSPLWGPCGWWSCPVVNIYNTNINNVIVNHHGNPPPQPLVPNAQGTPAVLRGGSPRGAGTAAARLNLPPNRVRELQEGRISARELRGQLTEPVSARTRSNYPSVQPATRGSRTDPRAAENPNVRSATPRTQQPSESATPRGTASPRQPGSVEVPRNSLRESPGTTQSRQPSDSSATRQPIQARPPLNSQTEQPRANAGDSTVRSGQPRAYSNLNPSGTIQPRATEEPRANPGDATSRSGQPRTNANENPTGTIQPRSAVPPRSGAGDASTAQPRSYSNRNPSGTIQARPALPSGKSGSSTPYRGPLTQPRSYSSPSDQGNGGTSRSQIPSRQPSGMSAPNGGYSRSAPSQGYSRPAAPQTYSRPSAPSQSYSRPSAPSQSYSRPSAPSQSYSRPSYSAPSSGHGSSAAPRSSAPSGSHSSPAPSSSGGGGGGGHKHR